MTVEEIYSTIAAHMIKGMMIHDELANYYDFLGLKGYKRCHEYHFLDETCAYRKLCRYYINHHNKLIPYINIDTPTVIPDNWYKHIRQDVDTNTRMGAVRNGLTMWVNWERETKKLYEKMYTELMNIDEVASAHEISKLVESVDCELKKAERYQLNKAAIDYDMTVIIEEQSKKHDKYREKTIKVGERLC